MTNTDTDALTEKIEGSLWGLWRVYDAPAGGTETFVHAPVHEVVAAVLPIVADEVRKAKAGAWQEGVNFALPGKETYWIGKHNPHCATETGGSDDRH